MASGDRERKGRVAQGSAGVAFSLRGKPASCLTRINEAPQWRRY